MFLKKILFIACMVMTALGSSLLQARELTITSISVGDVRVNSMMNNGALLTTQSLQAQNMQGQQQIYSVLANSPLWESQRAIYESSIPGIGFSLCQSDETICLRNNQPFSSSLVGYKLRLYKIGNIKGGDYNGINLMLIDNPVLGSNQIMIGNLRIYNADCVLTNTRTDVTFPHAILSDKPVISSVSFQLPVYCVNPVDYRNVLIDFKYNGTVSDSSIIHSNLNGLGIRIRDESGQTVQINQPQGRTYNSMKFMADLIRLAGQKAQAGEIDTSVTIVLTLR